METRLAARRQPLQATMATVSQTLEGAGHRLKKTLRSRVDTLLDRHSGRVGQDLSEFIGNFTPDWDQLAPPSVTPAFRPVLYQLFRHLPGRCPITSPMRPTSPWWNSSGSRKSGCARNWSACGSPCF